MKARCLPPLMATLLTAMTTLLSIVAAGVLATAPSATSAQARNGLPQHLADTGLYVAGSTTQVQPQLLAYAPQYPLWSDGADKRRWM